MKSASTAATAFGLLLVGFLAGTAAAQSASAGPSRVPPEQQGCILNIMRSYLFKGRRTSTTKFQSLVCPSVKNTCCNRFDEQRAFHLVNDLLPSRLLEYREKIKSAVIRFKLLRQHILARKPVFQGSQRRQDYCFREFRRLDAFGWPNFQEQLFHHLEADAQLMDTHYHSFFCAICDANNHKNFVFRQNNQGFLVDSKFCNDFLEHHKELFDLWNIQFIGLTINIQNVVDCFHYRSSFNMPFFDEVKRKQMDSAGRCVNSLSAKFFLQNCKQICDKVTFANIVDLIEGDFEFMTIAANLFERYLRVRETGRAVSNGLRSFFKSLTLHDPNHPESLGQLDVNYDTFRMGFDFDPQIHPSSSRNVIRDKLSFDEVPEHVNNDPHPHTVFRRKLVQKMPSGSTRRAPGRMRGASRPRMASRARHLGDYPQQTTPHTPKATRQPTPALHLAHKRQLQAPDAGDFGAADGGKPGNFKASKKKVRQVPLVFSRELKNKYDMIFIVPRSEKAQGIFEMEQKPMDFDRATRFYDLDNGINLFKYRLAFDIPERQFYLRLFSYRKSEPISVAFFNFLSDFGPKFRVSGMQDLTADFKVEARYWANPLANPDLANQLPSLYKKER